MELTDDNDNLITLQDEEGNEHEFEVVDVIEVAGKEYALLLPADAEEEDEESVLVLRFDDDTLSVIEDEAEFNQVVAYLEELGEEVEDTTEEEETELSNKRTPRDKTH
ncbi:MAG: DUF1292 domain-containing protein [Cyanobacteria bacterium NC_groundwater_1444_Ag_S-0.65um_54_12]|nr:DUF1292 domain-containing protein [Cyanobacteria bacterium NC_groundwater_1444_Ag_S-0.65um_54_12]